MSKLIYGVGFNSRGRHKTKINGTHTSAYKTWFSMILRCYCANTRKRCPTYLGCTVDGRWLDFQDFANWFYDNPYSNMGYHLDKDLLIPGNKVYSSETCCFVPQELNNLLTNRAAARGLYLQGVILYKPSGKYQARVMVDGKKRSLGYYDTELEAYQAYKEAEEANVKRMALNWQDRIASDVFDALMNWELDSK